MTMSSYDCVIPCAGLSSRMGDWKPLVPYHGRPLIIGIVETALRTSEKVILVTGYRSEELEQLFSKERRIITIRNEKYERGMFSSIQTGVPRVETEWFFIALGDMPLIPAELFEKLATQAAGSPGFDILRPVYREKPGHPVLLRRTVVETILDLPHTADMQRVFSEHHNRTGRKVMKLSVDYPGCIYDVDTKKDLEAASSPQAPPVIQTSPQAPPSSQLPESLREPEGRSQGTTDFLKKRGRIR